MRVLGPLPVLGHATARERRWVYLCVAIALCLRLGVAMLWWNRVPVDDERAYQAVALGILDGRGFVTASPIGAVNLANAPTSLWGCLQPLYLAGVYYVAGREPGAVYLINAFLGLIPVLVSWHLAKAAGGSRAGLVAATWLAIDPHLLKLSASLMTEPLYNAVLWLGIDRSVAWWTRSGLSAPLVAGVALALATLSRSVAFPLAIVLLLWAWVEARCSRRVWLGSAVFVAALALTLAPWVARNLRVHERPVLLDTKGGWNLYQYSHPDFDVVRGNPVPLPVELRNPSVSESRRNEILGQAAVGFVRSEPWRLVRQAPAKLGRLWSPMPDSRTDARLGASKLAFLLPFELCAVVGIARWRWRTAETRVLLLVLLCLSLVHTVIPGGPRFRAPLDPALAVFAGLAWSRLPSSGADQSRMSSSTPE